MKTCARLCLLGATLLVGACQILPEPQTDPTRTYILDTPAAPVTMAEGPRQPIVLRPVELPGYLRDRSMVVRRGENEIELREFAIWGEPLEQGIARVLREDLLRRGFDVSAGTRNGTGVSAVEVRLRVLQCEGDVDGRVHFRIGWEIQPAEAAPARRGIYEGGSALRWDGKTEAQLAARISEAVAALAGELAAEVRR